MWFSQADRGGLAGTQREAQSAEAARYWEPWTWAMFAITYRNTPPAVVTFGEIGAWELEFGVQLPRSLTRALTTQNGGRLLGTEIDIYPLDQFATLNQGAWAPLALAELPDEASRHRMFDVGSMPGGTLVLDCRRQKRTHGSEYGSHIRWRIKS